MKYLVHTPFRCGSSYLTRFLEKNNNDIEAKFAYNYTNYIDDENLVIKSHNDDILYDIRFDYIFTCIRKPTQIFLSAFIKDLKTVFEIGETRDERTTYPYYYDKDVTLENIDDIVDMFMSLDWDSYGWVDYDTNFRYIRKLTGINIWNEPFDKEQGYGIYTGCNNTKVIPVTHDILFNPYRFHNFQELCKNELKFNNLEKGIFSYRNSDTYGELYDKFLESVPSEFYQKYKYLDDRIIDKFL